MPAGAAVISRVDSAPAAGAPARPGRKIKVNPLRCKSESCDGLLAFEETDEGFLMGNMILLADEVEGKRFFPCPKCRGRNLVDEVEHGGRTRVRVFGFEPDK